MKLLEKTYDTPEENLACDEALLLDLEENGGEEVLRFWEPETYFVVLGHANKVDLEVNRRTCDEKDIPIYRRFSGGGTVVNGPGCMSFSLLLEMENHNRLLSIQETNRYVLARIASALQPLVKNTIALEGTSDLTINGKKFSGNAQHRKQRYVLFHGTILYDFDLPLINELLRQPTRQPDYRQNRKHHEFVMNFPAEKKRIGKAIQSEWNADEPLPGFSQKRINELVDTRYSQYSWNFKF